MPISQSDSFLFASLLLDTRNPGSEETKKSEGREREAAYAGFAAKKGREYRFSRITVCAKGEEDQECVAVDCNCKEAEL